MKPISTKPAILAAALAVLAGAGLAAVDGGFRAAPEINTQAAVDLMLRLRTFFRHRGTSIISLAVGP